MKGENYVYFSESSAAGAGTASMYPAANFMGMDSASATTAKLYFKPMVEGAAGQGAGDDNETVLITFPNTGTAGNLNYAQICEVISGALQGRNNKNFTVIADQANGNYLYPLTSTVTITPGA